MDRKSELEDKISDWLANEGYRLEFITHNAFNAAGLRASMNFHVKSAEGVLREIDVSAVHASKNGSKPGVRLLCECKYSEEQPWVVLHTGLKSDPMLDWFCLPKSTRIHRRHDEVAKRVDVLSKTAHFQKDKFVAFNVVQALKKHNRDDAFGALSKIANAGWDYVNSLSDSGNYTPVVAIPCIIVKAPMYRAQFSDKEGKFVVQPCSFDRISWSGCEKPTMVDIVHLDAVSDYARLVKSSIEAIVSVLEDLDAEELI